MSTTIARKLQETVRPSLAALPGLSLRLANEDPTGEPLPLPAAVISARDIDDNYTVKVDGRFARNAELRVACRVDGNLPGSAEAVEALASAVESAIEPTAGEWTFFQPFRQADERTWEGTTRVITLSWKLIVLAAI